MEFNKQTVKALLGVVCGGIAFAAALLHLDVVAGAAGWLLGILSPLLLGCAIAFILNVPMRAMERCLFPHAKKANKLRRPLALLLTVAAVSAVLALAGNYNWNEVVRQAQTLYGGWQPTGEKRPVIETNAVAPRVMRRKKDIEQLHLCLGFPSCGIGAADVYPTAVFNSAYGGAMSSRLFQSIREERGMAYSVYSYPNPMSGTGVLAVYAGTSPEHASEVVRMLNEETKKLAEGGLTEKEFKQAKEQLLSGFILGQESTSSRMNAIGRRLLLLGDTQTDEDVVEKIRGITFEGVNTLARRVLTSPRSAAIVGNGAEDVEI